MRITILGIIICANVALSAASAATASAKSSKPTTPDAVTLLKNATYAISFAKGRFEGEGHTHLMQALAKTQFVLIGESHYDHDTPLFVEALYRELNSQLGYHHFVVEQDPIGIEDTLKPGIRGNAAAMAEVAKRDPYLIGFASDQDLQLLADIGNLEKVPDPIWGLEQAQGTTRYLEELSKLSATSALRAECDRLLAAAKKIEASRGMHGNFLSDDPEAYAQMQSLREHFAPAAGSREKKLLDGLVKSAEIYSYYRRAEAGEYVGLFNNTVRETLFKDGFMADYHRSVALGDAVPKAVFKFGDEHMYHGLNTVGAFPIGNFAHEFAIANGLEAYSIDVFPVGSYSKWSDFPVWMRPLIPSPAPTSDVIIDLRALRPYQRLLRAKLAEKDLASFRMFINGFDAVVFLPNSRKAEMALTGFPNPF
jgi:hypothetical protein